MIRKLLFLPLILVFISCTITKRVHRAGYHVQWKKVERTQNVDTSDEKIKEGNLSIPNDKIHLEPAKSEQLITGNINRTILTRTVTVQQLDDSDMELASIEKTFEETQSVRTHKVETFKKTSFSHLSLPPLFWRTPAENLRKLGIALMIIGGMFLFGSLLVYMGAFSGNGGGAWLGFFLDLIDISGWYWLLFFIVAVVLISYLFFLLVLHVLGGPVVGLFVGLGFFAIGLFLYTLGKRRQVEP